MRVDIFEKEMVQLINPNAELVKLETNFDFTEGPVWNKTDRFLYFSDIPANTIFRFNEEEGLQAFRKPSNFSNGLVFDPQGRLLACEHQTRRVTRISEKRGEIIADGYKGKKLNSPNDLVLSNDGSVFFTDPNYGLRANLGGPGEKELNFQGVFRVPANADKPLLIADDFEAPNGLAFSPDESRLYVNDTLRMHIRKFEVGENYEITGGEVLCEVTGKGEGKPDGMKVDMKGNIYCTGPMGIWVFTKNGHPLGRVRVPERVSNLNWGGQDNKTLYITAGNSIYKIKFLISGNFL